MLQLPPIPPFDALHPLVIHFPIVLLLLSPVFVLISAILPPAKARPYLVAALAILMMGTISLFAAEVTGAAAARQVGQSDAVNAILASHKHLAWQTAVVFSGLLIILLAIVLLPDFLDSQKTRLITTLLPMPFLVLYCAGILFIVNTAYAGGRLAHPFGAHAAVSGEKSLSGETMPSQISGKEQRP